MRPGRATPLTHKQSISDLKRPSSARGFRPPSSVNSSRPSSSFGSRPGTPLFRADPYTGSITVSIRPNPLSASNPAWEIDQLGNTITNVHDSLSFAFDNVFPALPDVSNLLVYERSCAELVQKFLHGYNSTLFAYGMTGLGKTYSMKGDTQNPGFIKLAVDDVFAYISLDTTKQYHLSVSYMEIYNEKIVDLLSPSQSTDIKIRDDPEYGVRIVGINSPAVSTKESLLLLISQGDTRRKTSATDYNTRSSRSHAILQLKLQSVDVATSSSTYCVLSLCDLAGSERATSCAERRKEGAFINKSLLALSSVINKLSQSSLAAHPVDHVPYRDSKLTRLLQPALSGLLLILILCNVHLGLNLPALNQQFVTETLNTLRFAARAKHIVMTVKPPKKHGLADPDAARMIDDLRRTIESQKMELDLLRMHGASSVPDVAFGASSAKLTEAAAEIKMLQEKLEHLTRLSDIHKTETVLLRNDALNDILGMDMEKNTQMAMMSNLEEFYKRMAAEVDEYKNYNRVLENKLRMALQQLEAGPAGGIGERHYEELLKDQEEEIWNLKQSLKDKDSVIHSLTKTSKLRRLVDASNTFNRALGKEN